MTASGHFEISGETARFAIVAMAIAIGAWSFDLALNRGESRVAGLAGSSRQR